MGKPTKNDKHNDKNNDNDESSLDRRDFVTGAAGLAAAVAGIGTAQAGGHLNKPTNFSAEI